MMGDMRIVRRTFVKGALASTAALLAPHVSRAQDWPNRPVRFIVHLAAGGGLDFIARLVGEPVSRSIGQQVFIENRTGGAGGTIGIEAGIKSPPDGYNFLIANDNIVSAPHVQKLGIDYLKDVMPVSLLGRQPTVLAVHPSFEANSVAELVAAVKKQPGTGCATSGVGSNQHVLMEWFNKAADIKLDHVPYRGAGQAINDLVAGHVKVAFLGPTATLPQAAAQKIRLLAQSGEARSPAMPDLPTLQEARLPGHRARILVCGIRAARHAACGHRAAQCGIRQGACRKVRARLPVEGRDRGGRRRHRAARQARARGLGEV